MAIIPGQEAKENVLTKLRQLISAIENNEIMEVAIVPAYDAHRDENLLTIYYTKGRLLESRDDH